MFIVVPLSCSSISDHFCEEEYLRNKFGNEYDEYCARVNRFVPSLRNARRSPAGMRFDWKISVRKDLGTIVDSQYLLLIPVWRTYSTRDGLLPRFGMTSFAVARTGGLYGLCYI
jgi:hypothetical protein